MNPGLKSFVFRHLPPHGASQNSRRTFEPNATGVPNTTGEKQKIEYRINFLDSRRSFWNTMLAINVSITLTRMEVCHYAADKISYTYIGAIIPTAYKAGLAEPKLVWMNVIPKVGCIACQPQPFCEV